MACTTYKNGESFGMAKWHCFTNMWIPCGAINHYQIAGLWHLSGTSPSNLAQAQSWFQGVTGSLWGYTNSVKIVMLFLQFNIYIYIYNNIYIYIFIFYDDRSKGHVLFFLFAKNCRLQIKDFRSTAISICVCGCFLEWRIPKAIGFNTKII